MKNVSIMFWASIGIAACGLAIAAMACSQNTFSEQYTDKTAGDNSGFETSKNGLPANWLVYTQKTAGSGRFTIATDNTLPHTGKQSLKIAVTQCSDKGGRFSPGIDKEFELSPGNYQVTYWTRNNGTRYRVQLSGVTAAGSNNGPTDTPAADTGKWTMHTLQYTMPADMQRLRFELNVLSPGTLWIDDVQVVKLQ